ncbi:TPA: aldehyde dehydrogenase [Klebsiella pneumoniae]|nr:aldehyde dehydrogenase [Klebsiella pneumoniae]
MVKVGINGFGRIGRNVLRAALNNPDIQIVAINDLTDSKTLAHLLKYDSLLGKLDAEVTAGEGGLVVDGKPITVFSERNPASIPWRQCEVDIVIEATGLFTDREKAAVHIHSGGAKRVIISAPGKNDDLTIVMGVNESLYSPDKHYVISNGSCTTNGLAPAAQVLHQHFGIVSSDYQGDPRSSIIDGLSTLVIGGNMVKILAWYDNEWGFSNRLVDLALMMAKRES